MFVFFKNFKNNSMKKKLIEKAIFTKIKFG